MTLGSAPVDEYMDYSSCVTSLWFKIPPTIFACSHPYLFGWPLITSVCIECRINSSVVPNFNFPAN